MIQPSLIFYLKICKWINWSYKIDNNKEHIVLNYLELWMIDFILQFNLKLWNPFRHKIVIFWFRNLFREIYFCITTEFSSRLIYFWAKFFFIDKIRSKKSDLLVKEENRWVSYLKICKKFKVSDNKTLCTYKMYLCLK